jgi:hypothetical protein
MRYVFPILHKICVVKASDAWGMDVGKRGCDQQPKANVEDAKPNVIPSKNAPLCMSSNPISGANMKPFKCLRCKVGTYLDDKLGGSKEFGVDFG